MYVPHWSISYIYQKEPHFVHFDASPSITVSVAGPRTNVAPKGFWLSAIERSDKMPALFNFFFAQCLDV